MYFTPGYSSPDYSFEWQALGGTIIAGGFDNYLRVRWENFGTYMVVVYIYNRNHSLISIGTLSVEVKDPNQPPNIPDPGITVIGSSYQFEPTEISLNYQINNQIDYITWSGDGYISNGQGTTTPTFIFLKLGENTIEATYRYKGKTSESKRTFNVNIPNVRKIITGPYSVYYDGATFSIDGLNSALDVNWSFTNNRFDIISGQGNSSVQIKPKIGIIGQDYIEATISYGNSSGKLGKYIHANIPTVESISGPSNARSGEGASYIAYPDLPRNYFTYEWGIEPNDGASLYPNHNYLDVHFSSVGQYTLWCRTIDIITGERQGGSPTRFTVNVGSYYKIYPNPTDGVIYLELEEGYSSANKNSSLSYEVFKQANGIKVKNGTINANGDTIDLSTYSSGIYILRLEVVPGIYESHKIIVK